MKEKNGILSAIKKKKKFFFLFHESNWLEKFMRLIHK